MLRPAVSDVSFLYFEPNVICVYEACIGVTHFAVVKLRKQKMSLPHQPEVSLRFLYWMLFWSTWCRAKNTKMHRM